MRSQPPGFPLLSPVIPAQPGIHAFATRKWPLIAILIATLGAPQAARPDAGDQITIDNFTFSPAALTVTKGTEIHWTNHDDIPHSIVVGSVGVHSKAMDTDGSFGYRFDKAGTFGYICGLHPNMHGQIVVR